MSTLLIDDSHPGVRIITLNRPHALNAAFALERFTTGHLIDEHGAAGVAH